jgi:cytochrome b561
MDKISESLQINEKTFRQVSFGLIALMLTCGAFTLISLINRLLPDWQPWYLAGLVFFVTLERMYTYRRFRDLSVLSQEWAFALGTEWVVLLALIRLVVGLSHGLPAFLAEIPRWSQAFGAEFFSLEYFFAAILALLAWLVSGSFADLLDELGFEQAVILQNFPALENDKAPVRERLLNQIFSLGTVLIVLTALVRVDLRGLLEKTGGPLFSSIPALAGGGASTLLYFMLGLALLSQTQFIDLHTRWSLQAIPINRSLAGRWAFYSLIFLGLLAALVSLLPTSYSLGLLYLIGYGLSMVSGVLFMIVEFLLSIIMFIFSLPFLLLGQKPPTENVRFKPPQLPQAPAADPTSAAPIWWEMLKTFGFWAIFLGILIFSVLQYLRQHEEVLAALRKLPGAAFLIQLVQWLRGLFAGVKTGLAKAVAAGQERLRTRQQPAQAVPGNGFLNLRRLDPRQKVYFYYLTLLRRSGETGLPRRPSQTPAEFATTLELALPAADDDISALTEAFVEARYTRRPVGPEKANRVKEYWEHLRQALRGKKVKSGK